MRSAAPTRSSRAAVIDGPAVARAAGRARPVLARLHAALPRREDSSGLDSERLATSGTAQSSSSVSQGRSKAIAPTALRLS
jgi:hypothetical protein